MTRSPAGDDPPIEGGGAAERLRQFLAARSPDEISDPVDDRDEEQGDETDAAPRTGGEDGRRDKRR